MIPQRNLSVLSNRLARKGGRRIPETVLERDYCLSWFLVGMSETPLTDLLAFKGGTAIKKCYLPDYRFSEDLDFTLKEDAAFNVIQEHLAHVFEYVMLPQESNCTSADMIGIHMKTAILFFSDTKVLYQVPPVKRLKWTSLYESE